MSWCPRFLKLFSLSILLTSGCATTPQLDNPTLIKPGDVNCENPVMLTPGQPTPEGYAEIYDRVIDALDDYFEIKPSSRYSGIIETYPRVAPGWEQFWKPSTHSSYERWLATTQSMRQYATVRIWAGEQGGYKVYVEVFKELEDVSQPITSRSSTTIFRDAATVDRLGETIVGNTTGDLSWLPAGNPPHRDFSLEQAILQKILRPGAVK